VRVEEEIIEIKNKGNKIDNEIRNVFFLGWLITGISVFIIKYNYPLPIEKGLLLSLTGLLILFWFFLFLEIRINNKNIPFICQIGFHNFEKSISDGGYAHETTYLVCKRCKNFDTVEEFRRPSLWKY